MSNKHTAANNTGSRGANLPMTLVGVLIILVSLALIVAGFYGSVVAPKVTHTKAFAQVHGANSKDAANYDEVREYLFPPIAVETEPEQQQEAAVATAEAESNNVEATEPSATTAEAEVETTDATAPGEPVLAAQEIDTMKHLHILTVLYGKYMLAAGIIALIAGIIIMVTSLHLGLHAYSKLSNSVIYAILVLISIIWLIPFVCILLQSFRVESTHQVGYVIPHVWGIDNYTNLLNKTDFPKWYVNTFVIALVTSVLQTIIVLCMSYTLSRFRFAGRKLLMRIMLILGMFPGMLTMIILYRVLADLNLTQANAVPGLILVYIASSGMGYYVSKGFFDTIPKSLDEAARVDGATRFQVLKKIILPLSKPIVIYTILTAFMAPWGDFVFARYISNNTSAGFNVAVGMYNWLNKDQINSYYTSFCAGGVMVALPVTVLFLFLQKYYVEGVTGGAVKG